MKKIFWGIFFGVIILGFGVGEFLLAQHFGVDIENVTPTNPLVGQPVTIEIFGFSTEGAPRNNVVTVRFGDGDEGTISCELISPSPPIGGLPGNYQCEGSLTHTYNAEGTYDIVAEICVWLLGSSDWHCVEDIFSITVGPSGCVPDGCNGICPPGCDVNQDPDCGCRDNDGCCAPGCDPSNDNDCLPPTPTQPTLPTGYQNPLLWANVIQFLLHALRFIFNVLIGLCILMIVLSGIFLATSRGDPVRQAKGKRVLIFALIGFAIAFLAQGLFMLFRIIFGVKI